MAEPQKPEDRFGWDDDTPIKVVLPKDQPDKSKKPEDDESGAG